MLCVKEVGFKCCQFHKCVSCVVFHKCVSCAVCFISLFGVLFVSLVCFMCCVCPKKKRRLYLITQIDCVILDFYKPWQLHSF